jgi:transposase
LDNAGYNKTADVIANAKKLRIKLHFLPPRSPKMNPLERLWKVMNEQVRNNVSFKKAKEFREAIVNFFAKIGQKIKEGYVDRIHDAFHIEQNTDMLGLAA